MFDGVKERTEIGVLIDKLGFNTKEANKFLVMLNGHMPFLAYDDGQYNAVGKFPIFHCGPLDAIPKCKWSGWDAFEINNGQYCRFTVTSGPERTCLDFEGYHMGELKMSHAICSDDERKLTGIDADKISLMDMD